MNGVDLEIRPAKWPGGVRSNRSLDGCKHTVLRGQHTREEEQLERVKSLNYHAREGDSVGCGRFVDRP